jgi:hypothetical protein
MGHQMKKDLHAARQDTLKARSVRISNVYFPGPLLISIQELAELISRSDNCELTADNNITV